MFNLNEFYKDVINWNTFVGNSYLDFTLSEVYKNLVKEEMGEMFKGLDEGDGIEYLDGLVDTLVVGSFLYALVDKNDFENYGREAEQVNDFDTTLTKLKKLFNREKYVDDIIEIVEMCEDIAYSSDMDVLGACDEVMRSNWSKFPKVGEVDPDKEVERIESEGRYKGITYAINKDNAGQERYIFKADTGKIVKPSTFEEPNLIEYV